MAKKDPSAYQVMKDFKDAIVKVTEDYNVALKAVEKAVTELEKHKTSFWVAYKSWVVIGFVFLLGLIGYAAYKIGGDCSFSFSNQVFSINLHEKECSIENGQ